MCEHVCVCACVCVRERESERVSLRERVRRERVRRERVYRLDRKEKVSERER